DAKLMVELHLTTSPKRNDVSVPRFVQRFRQAVPQARGVAVFVSKPGALPQRWQPAVEDPELFGVPDLSYVAAGEEYRVSAGSFFQVNRHLVDTMVERGCADKKGKIAIDLYAGVGLFTVPLAKRFDRVIAVEGDASSFGDLERNKPENVTA